MSETDDDDLLARAIGWVFIEAGRAEGTAGELLMLHRASDVSVKSSGWHESGEPLVKALRGLAARRDLVELTALADRLNAAAQWRHDVVHGEWIPAPAQGMGIVTFRRERPKVAPEGGYAGKMWTIEGLQGLSEEYKGIERGLADLVSDFMGPSRSSF